MFPASWVSGPNLSSGRLDRFLRWAALAEFAASFACVFVLYCWYRTLTGRSSPLLHVSIQLILAAIGAAGAFGAVFLSEAMWNYWRNHDLSPKRQKTFWNWIMVLFVVFGCTAYYHLVYRRQIRETAFPSSS